jgi:hypothetical protein
MTHTVKDAYKRIAALPWRVKAVMACVLAAGIAALSFFSAGGFNSPASAAPPFPNSVSAPAGYQVTYGHDFTTQGMGDWATQPRPGATVSVSSSYGLRVEVTGEDQWAEVISSDAVIGPNSFVQGLVYIPPGPNGYTAMARVLVDWLTVAEQRRNRHAGGAGRPLMRTDALRGTAAKWARQR